jgi:hypothetical protein
MMKQRRVISFDVDGVVASGGFIPVEERSAERYEKCTLLDLEIPRYINQLARTHDVYFISSRNHVNALDSTHEWLYEAGIYMDYIKGTICGIPAYNKPFLCRMLGVSAHFDDDPAAVTTSFGWLVNNPTWPANQEAIARYAPQVVNDWREIMEVIYKKLDQRYQQMLIPFPVAA